VLAAGAGAEARKVMGMAVFAGLLVATSLGIFLIPMLYVVVQKYFVRERSPEPARRCDDGAGAAEKGAGV